MKRAVSILFSLALIISALSSMPFSALGFDLNGSCGKNVSYSFNTSTKTLTISGSGDMTTYYMKDCYSPFRDNKSIEKVIVKGSVNSIGNCSFVGCTNLNKVTIEEGVRILGEDAFYNCTSLSDVSIPNSLMKIGSRAFYNTAIKNSADNWDNGFFYYKNCLINVDSSVSGDVTVKQGTRILADSAFANCNSINTVTFQRGLKSIGEMAFDSSSVQSIFVPNGVTRIYDAAFMFCRNLNNISLPHSLRSIGAYAFYGCNNLKSVDYRGSNEAWNNISISEGNDIISSNSVSISCIDYLQDAQSQALTVADSEETNQYVPSYSYYKYSYSQYIITENELYDMKGTNITSLIWYLSSFAASRNYDVYLCSTQLNSLSAFAEIPDDSIVFSGEWSLSDDNRAVIELDAPFMYEGGNLLITVADNTGSYMSGNIFYGEQRNGASVASYGDSNASAVNPTQRNFVPKTTFIYFENHTHSLTKVPAAAATTTADGNIEYYICSGEDGCGKIFEDAQGTVEITDASIVVIPKIIVDSKLNIEASSISASCSAKNKTLTVKWKAVKNATDYEINYRKAGASKWTSKTTGNKTSYVIKNLSANGLYEFRIRSVSVTGKQKSQSSWSATTRRYIYQAKQTKLTAGKGSVTTTWSKDKNASSYEIQYSTDKDFKKNVKKTTAKKSETKKTIKSLTKRKRYYVRVRSIKKYSDKSFIGQWSNVKYVTTKK